jgi:hypothetical protein
MSSKTICISAVALLALTACVSSRQARNVTPGGFLGPSSQLLEKGKRGEEALLVYHNTSARWAGYDRVILDPIAIWDASPVKLTADQAADFDVQNILTYWSDLTVYRLCLDRAAVGCLRPSAGLTDQ